MAKKKITKFVFILVLVALIGGVAFLALTDVAPPKGKVVKEIDNARFK